MIILSPSNDRFNVKCNIWGRYNQKWLGTTANEEWGFSFLDHFLTILPTCCRLGFCRSDAAWLCRNIFHHKQSKQAALWTNPCWCALYLAQSQVGVVVRIDLQQQGLGYCRHCRVVRPGPLQFCRPIHGNYAYLPTHCWAFNMLNVNKWNILLTMTRTSRYCHNKWLQFWKYFIDVKYFSCLSQCQTLASHFHSTHDWRQ